jgi:transcription elongation factor Elf1
MIDTISPTRECPFCGEHETQLYIKPDGDRYCVQCPTCHARGGNGYTPDEAVHNWDRRFP